MRQQVGNFPGVTVDKLSGTCTIAPNVVATITDLPGTYSLYPKRTDEWVVYNILLGLNDAVKPNLIVLLADASNLKRNLLFCSQIADLKIPVVVCLTMMDIAKANQITIDLEALQRALGLPVIAINPRKKTGTTALLKLIAQTLNGLYKMPVQNFINLNSICDGALQPVKEKYETQTDYKALQLLMHHHELFNELDNKKFFDEVQKKYNFNKAKVQAEEIIQRFAKIKVIMAQAVTQPDPLQKSLYTQKLDKILLHRTWGYAILVLVLLTLFQAMSWLAQYPMDVIEYAFTKGTSYLNNLLPSNILSDVLVNGLLPGIGGVLVFVPQIAILFGLITVLEDTGYMARISFLTDRLMRKVGLNGKSVVPLISGFACAVPAIMSARNIENKKERLLTILVIPLMSCSARLPVYTTIIGLVIPNQFLLGFVSVRGLVMLGLYVLGIVLLLLCSYIFSFLITNTERSFFMLELPIYRAPRWINVAQTMLVKSKIFLWQAGKIIIVISIILWVLCTYSPTNRHSEINKKYNALILSTPDKKDSLTAIANSEKLATSYAGYLGRAIEPAIRPLGYDWRIGIALITSFAAREVFVGTMATLYSVGNNNNDKMLQTKMRQATLSNGKPVYTVASGASLLVFYALAMQCMSTLAIVKRETKTWKWPILQLVYMTVLAYLLSWLTYAILS